MNETRYRIRLPATDFSAASESDVHFIVDHDGVSESYRFHDYDRIYAQPGLYEQIFYDRLKCCSPQFLAERMNQVVGAAGEDVHRLRVLDFGAGNGMMGEVLQAHGVTRVVGADISEVARQSMQRDRPGIYDDYCVADFSRLDQDTRERLRAWNFTCLTTVAALGFDDIPESALREAFNLVVDGGWIVFNIKETFLGQPEQAGYSSLIRELLVGGWMDLHHLERYRHRLSIEGNPLYYYAVIGRKRGDWR